jgi:small-conductance mechanosensitive channel|tara:strand:- start:1690 stop:2055 length:366 start_codon:yes stop_codon:yes gene_type:complete
VIENYTRKGTRRLDLVIGVSYGDDIKKVKGILQEILDNEARILKTPTPTIGLMEMGDSSINFAFRPWVNVEDYWDFFSAYRSRLSYASTKKALRFRSLNATFTCFKISRVWATVFRTAATI